MTLTASEMETQIKQFAEAVADFARLNDMPVVTEADFDAAVAAYIAHAQSSTDRLMRAGRDHPIVKVFFHQSAMRAQF